MNNTKMQYFEQEDILHLLFSDEPEANSVEPSPNITSPFDVPSIKTLATTENILEAIRESRREGFEGCGYS